MRNERWWTALHDPAIDVLTDAALADSPTLAQAVARVDEARATLGVASAQFVPSIDAAASATRVQVPNTERFRSPKSVQARSAGAGLNLSWEIDLWGRVRQTADAAQSRLDARSGDAQGARLSLAAQVADSILGLRACNYSLQVRADDIASRQTQLAFTRRRVSVGFAAPVDEARSASGLASARTDFILQQEQCAREVDALVALTGFDAARVRGAVAHAIPPAVSMVPDQAMTDVETPDILSAMPVAPLLQPALPATLLAGHPSVIAAEREVKATWAEIRVAEANRLPTIDLTALLTGNWLHAAGSTLGFVTWSLGPSVSAPLFDGGRGAANVSASEARYRAALATLRSTLRTTVQNVEDALAAQVSAEGRLASTRENLRAARVTLVASEAQWRAGALGLFELEDTRRQYAAAQESAITAARDRARAWVTLIVASGQPFNVDQLAANENP
jgi:NodT family efflux transporter outer membrane factor (OMF) lipoprotein